MDPGPKSKPVARVQLYRHVLNQFGNRTNDENPLSGAAHGED